MVLFGDGRREIKKIEGRGGKVGYVRGGEGDIGGFVWLWEDIRVFRFVFEF